jgi:dihydroflavonol-4-reductase
MITLVTGATGFVGSHVVRQLLAKGDTVRVLVRPASSMRALESLDVQVAQGDVRDASAVRQAARGVKRIYHVAADYRLWAKDPLEIYETNVRGTRNVLDAIHAGMDRVVYTSTVATIAVRRDQLPDETTEASLDEMIGHYKRSKLMAEHLVLDAAARGLPVVIVNPTTPVGPGDWRPTPTGQVIVDFLRRRLPAYVQTGLNVVPVEDVARGHLLAAEHGRIGERYLLGGRNMTLHDILDTLSVYSGERSPRICLPWRVAMVIGYIDQIVARLFGREPRIPLDGVRMSRHAMWADCTKAERELGFRPGSAEAALGRAVRWYTQQGYAVPVVHHHPRSRNN